ncbi:hypothetical protein [Actinoallomurus sp. NPDC050550]|uniref:hypothetical protein n=1 Tax=Actinoallomurus sp. NPDC050550 TaxID=3154937 RepID=UPI0033F9FD55
MEEGITPHRLTAHPGDLITAPGPGARWAAVVYPVATTSVAVLTADHHWLDGIVVVIVSVALSGRVERIVSRRGAQGT